MVKRKEKKIFNPEGYEIWKTGKFNVRKTYRKTKKIVARPRFELGTSGL